MRKSATVQKVPYLAPDVMAKIIPAPVDGWDAISPLAEMDPKRAPILNNWVPRPGFLELRGGYSNFCSTGSSTPVESLMTYRSATTEKLFAAANGSIFDVSAGGAGIMQLSGLSSNQWQYVNYTPLASATSYLQAVSGQDALIMYDGTNWTTPSITAPTGFSGFSTSNIINIYAQKRRLWYIMNASTVVVFMPTDAIQGQAAGFQDFGGLWDLGGFLVAMADWTIDGGSGPQDYALFISSRGQATLYSGTDPTNASAWNLVGTFNVAPPLGRRCMTRLGSDVAVITQQGVIPISQALPFDPSADRSIALTARIQNAMASSALMGQSLFGWELTSYPAQQLLILNVPQVQNTTQVQYVMNALTGAWCQFLGWNANTFTIFNQQLYWGDNVGNVNLGYVGSSDNFNSIFADMQCAFNWFDEPGRLKRITMVQPLLTLGGGLTPTLGVDVDFTTSGKVAPITSFTGTTYWDIALWDQAFWPASSTSFSSWLTVDAIGHALALRVQVNIAAVTGSSRLTAFDFAVFDTGVFSIGFDPTLPLLQVNAFNCLAELGGPI
jgi:hypothetical protein